MTTELDSSVDLGEIAKEKRAVERAIDVLVQNFSSRMIPLGLVVDSVDSAITEHRSGSSRWVTDAQIFETKINLRVAG